DHQRIAPLETPYAATGAAVDVVDVLGFEGLGAPDIVFVKGIAAIDDGIAGSEQLSQLFDGFLGYFTGWQHDPCGSRSIQKSGQVLEIGCASHALSSDGIDRGCVLVEDNAVMAISGEATDDVTAHTYKANDPKLHCG